MFQKSLNNDLPPPLLSQTNLKSFRVLNCRLALGVSDSGRLAGEVCADSPTSRPLRRLDHFGPKRFRWSVTPLCCGAGMEVREDECSGPSWACFLPSLPLRRESRGPGCKGDGRVVRDRHSIQRQAAFLSLAASLCCVCDRVRLHVRLACEEPEVVQE